MIGNALSRGNPEVEFVLDHKIPYRSLPETLEEFFLPGHDSLVVTGTHGKTTTTSMLSWILHHAGRRPNFLIGGVAENFGNSFGLGGGNEFILEGDEYDSAFFDKAPKFLHYHPRRIDHHFAGIRSCRYLRGSGGHRAAIPAAGESGAAAAGASSPGARAKRFAAWCKRRFARWRPTASARSRLDRGRHGIYRRRDALPRLAQGSGSGARAHGPGRAPQCSECAGGDRHRARTRRQRRSDRRSAWRRFAASCGAWK